LGEDGKLGGEPLDRVAGFWRVLGLTPPPDADHLGSLLMLYAELGDAETAARCEQTRKQLQHAREALLWEHLWSWAPAYLAAVERLDATSLSRWARLTRQALGREARQADAPVALPLTLRAAPAPISACDRRAASACRDRLPADGGDLPGALLTPVRSGVLLTRQDLRDAAAAVGVGYRLGERRYTLQAMLSQDAPGILGWLSAFASKWAGWHAGQEPIGGVDPRHWWARRAQRTSAALSELQRELVTAG
jgi:hypothetical protein